MTRTRWAAACASLLAVGLALFLWAGQGAPAGPAEARIAHGARLFEPCAACHSIQEGAPDRNGPNLHGIVGSPVAGSSPRFGYTAALRALGGRWDAARLDAWLENPQRFAPGNRMAFPGMPDPAERADLIAYLRTQGTAARHP